MFKLGNDNMRMESTPERVYALCKYLMKNPSTIDRLRNELTLYDIFGEKSDNEIKLTLEAAMELNLVVLEEGIYKVSDNAGALDSVESFRKYAAKTALSGADTLFFKTTSMYLRLAETISENRSWSSIAAYLTKMGLNVTENDMLGWRFWASFLGVGYLHGTFVIPNCSRRIEDVLENCDQFGSNSPVPVAVFFQWLEAECPELKGSREDNKIGLAVSNALRTLETKDRIGLVLQPDAPKWLLYTLESEQLNEISHVRIKR